MKQITQDPPRQIIENFAKAIQERKAPKGTAKPPMTVINFRDEKQQGFERPIEIVPTSLLRYRKDNGRIASDVLSYEHQHGPLREQDDDAQRILYGFLKRKNSHKTDELIKSIEHSGQDQPAIITCDGFLINGNRRKMALEELQQRYPGREQFELMKVVILPGMGDPGGPPTLKEIERLENRYQLQSDGKSEYYSFDRALSMKRKIRMGLSLEEQLRDDPQFIGASEKELKAAVAKYQSDYLDPLDCIDRYLAHTQREGVYEAVSSGQSDKDGRWQAFLDYSNVYNKKLRNAKWREENDVDEGVIGKVEDVAFKLIRFRNLRNLGKVHDVMRSLPAICSRKESRKEFLKIADEVNMATSKDDQFNNEGKAFSWQEIDTRWANRHQTPVIYHVKKALDFVQNSKDRETPMTLLDTALKKLNHDDLTIDQIGIGDYPKARELIRGIAQRARELEHDLFDREKQLKELSKKK